MLAICSDLDETPDRNVYGQIMRFLNTNQTTAMGPGVGLEVGNSIYFDMPPGQFSYWNTDDAGREMIRALIRSGHIDCLHSYGDLAATRAHAGRALDELDRRGCRLEVWVDHGVAATNFGDDIMCGHGDEPGHEAYHADLTTGHGVRYVWRGRVTSVTGQDVRPRFGGLFSAAHPLASGRTLAREVAKHVLARSGSGKYAMHGPNELMRPVALRDGRGAYEFMRCNPHWGGLGSCDRGSRIGSVLTADALDRLVDRQGTCVLYTHLGKIEDPQRPFGPSAVEGFRRLAGLHRQGKLLVTTTRRLLGFHRALRELSFTVERRDGNVRVDLSTIGRDSMDGLGSLPQTDLAGLTFYVPQPERTRVFVDGRQADPISNAPDHTHRPSVSLPWHALEFPQL